MTTSKTGEAAANEALKSIGITNYQTLLNAFNTDRYDMAGGNTSYVQDFLEQKCGIRVNNTDTGAITGSDAGGKTSKTAESIIPESSSAKTPTTAQYDSFTTNGLTVNITYDEPDNVGSEYDYEVSNYIEKQKLIVKKLYNWWIPEALNLINESLGINFTDGRANTNTLDIKFSSGYKPVSYEVTYDSGLASKMTITIGTEYLFALTDSDKNGTLSNGVYIEGLDTPYFSYYERFGFTTKYFDRVLLTALTHLTLESNISHFSSLPFYLRQGLVGIVNGFDDSDVEKTSYIVDYNDEDPYLSSYALMRYLAKQYTDGKASDTIYIHNKDNTTGNSGNDTWIVTSNTKNATINTGGGKDTIQAFGGDGVVINGTSGADAITVTKSTISGSGEVATIIGGKGNDTLNGGKGNDTLTGGSGKDVFLFASGEGNDVITDYVVGTDSIKLTKGSVTKGTTSGTDVVLNIGSNKLTVKNASGKKLTIINSAGKSSTMLVGSSTTSTSDTMSYSSNKTILTLNSSFKGTLKSTDYVSSVKTIDASKVTNAIKIVGNGLANTIKGGSKADSISGGAGNDSILGNAGNDTLIGGKGNDTLTGGAGKDVFSYSTGDGNDVITDYTAGQDSIKLSKGTISKTSYSGNDVVFTIGSGKITVKNGKGKKITIEEANGDTSTKTYKNYEERWFMENDSTLATSEMSEILKSDNIISADNDYDSDFTLNDNLSNYKSSSILMYQAKSTK